MMALQMLVALLFCHIFVVNANTRIAFNPSNITVHMGEVETIEYNVTEIGKKTYY